MLSTELFTFLTHFSYPRPGMYSFLSLYLSVSPSCSPIKIRGIEMHGMCRFCCCFRRSLWQTRFLIQALEVNEKKNHNKLQFSWSQKRHPTTTTASNELYARIFVSILFDMLIKTFEIRFKMPFYLKFRNLYSQLCSEDTRNQNKKKKKKKKYRNIWMKWNEWMK